MRSSWVVLACGLASATAAACGSDDGGATVPTAAPTNTVPGDPSQPPPFVPPPIGTDTPPPAPVVLSIEPATIAINLTDRTVPKGQTFVLKEGTGASAVAVPAGAVWTLEKYDAGDINQSGLFQTNGKAAGTYKVYANYKGKTATAEIKITMGLKEQVGSPVSTPANAAALAGQPVKEAGMNPTKILYPQSGTVFPRGLTSPVLQFSPGEKPPEDAKIVLECMGFRWEGSGKVDQSGKPQVSIPQDAWDAFTMSCGGQKSTVSVVKANGGVAYGPATIDLTIAPASLKGAVFYQTYEEGFVGLWSVRPGVREPAKHLIKKCVVCHSVSANGEVLAAGSDGADTAAEAGTYKTNTAGDISQISAAPNGFGGDDRRMSFASLTPDGKYVMRSTNDFWGGINQRAFKTNQAGNATTQMAESQVVGLGIEVSAYVPMFSPDGKRYVFVNGDGTPPAFGTPRRSISTMDVTVDDTGPGKLTFANRQVALDNKASGLVIREPAFLPDSKQLVFQEGPETDSGYGGMLSLFSGNGGHLAILRGTEHLELKAANAGLSPADAEVQGMPTVLPVQAGGYFWVVFTSKRAYGNTAATGQKQLWVTAISPNTAPGVDPSHGAFYLPNQSPSKNERGFWALERCKAEGGSCQSGDECCDGFCRPEDPAAGKTKLVCKKPVVNQCANESERCKVDADCCTSGNSCVGGFCTPPVPN
jgi:hypothetical protein